MREGQDLLLWAARKDPSRVAALRALYAASRHLDSPALCGVAATFGIYGLGQGYRLAQASVAVPFEYSALFWAVLWGYLFWAVLWGYLFWAEVPAATTYVGIALVVGSGLYIFHRESIARKS